MNVDEPDVHPRCRMREYGVDPPGAFKRSKRDGFYETADTNYGYRKDWV